MYTHGTPVPVTRVFIETQYPFSSLSSVLLNFGLLAPHDILLRHREPIEHVLGAKQKSKKPRGARHASCSKSNPMVVAVHENEKTIDHKRNRPATFCFVPKLTPSINLTFYCFLFYVLLFLDFHQRSCQTSFFHETSCRQE